MDETLRRQWDNPRDIFTILMIIGGDFVQVALAQLCTGPIPGLTPVAFSFGWVGYALTALRSVVGRNRLMPKPELECKIINVDRGYSRTNHSWILSRLLLDYDYWQHPHDGDEQRSKRLQHLRQQNEQYRQRLAQQLRDAETRQKQEDLERELRELPDPEAMRVGLRVTTWASRATVAPPSLDGIYS